ncbi:MAG: hypothetical protein ACLSIR_08175 [Christensenellales bacterium]
MIRNIRRHDERAGADVFDQLVVLVKREGLEAPGSLSRRQTDEVARLKFRVSTLPPMSAQVPSKNLVSAEIVLPSGPSWRMRTDCSRSRRWPFADVVLVNVNADHIRLALDSRFHRRV